MKLIRYDAMHQAIDACHKVDEVKAIRDQAIALEAYCRAASNMDEERKVIEIRLRAERKAGQLLAASKESGERKGQGGDQKSKSTGTILKSSLKSLGITPDQSASWQKLGAMPKNEFDAAIGATTRKPSTKGILRETKPKSKETPVSSEALWLWGRLREFNERLLKENPKQVMSTLTSEMKNDVHTLAPKVAAWLKRVGEF
jgi:hypothetical protein